MISQRIKLYLNTFFAIALFIILPFSRLAYYSSEAQTLLLGLYLVVGVIWIGSLIKFPIENLQSPLNLGWFAVLIAISISSFYSLNPAQSWRLTWSWATAFITFFVVLFFLRIGLFTTKYVLQTILAVCFFFLLAGYVELGQFFIAWFDTGRFMPVRIGLINGFTESRNILVLLVLWIILITIGQIDKNNHRNTLWILLLVAASFLFLVIRSAGGYVALAGAIFVLIIGRSKDQIIGWWNQLSAKQTRLFFLISTLFGLTAAAAFSIWLVFDAGFSSRTILWKIAFESFQQNPVYGSGMGTYITAFLNSPEFPLRQSPLFYAHSLWFNILADSGLIGATAAAIWAILFVRFLTKNLSKILLSSTSMTLVSCLTAFLIYATVETPRPRLFLMSSIFIACLIFDSEPEPVQTKNNSRFFLVFWPCLYILLAGGIWQSFKVQQSYELGIEQVTNGDWAGAAMSFDHANETSYHLDTGILTAAAYSHAQLGYSDLNAAEEEIRLLNQLIIQEPAWPINHLHLALIHQTIGDFDQAEIEFQTAAELAPEAPYILLNQALFYREQGETGQMGAIDNSLYLLDGTWHDAPYWQNKKLPNFEYSCSDITCYYFKKEDSKRAWELLTIGQNEEARRIFEAIQPTDRHKRDLAVYLGLYLSGSKLMDGVSQEQMHAATARRTSLFFPFMAELFLVELVDEEYLTINLEHIMAQSAHAFGRRDNGDYIRLGFLRSSMPDDLLPAVQCFTADDHLAWQLNQLTNWYRINGRDDLAQIVQEALLGPNGNGVRPCINGRAITN